MDEEAKQEIKELYKQIKSKIEEIEIILHSEAYIGFYSGEECRLGVASLLGFWKAIKELLNKFIENL